MKALGPVPSPKSQAAPPIALGAAVERAAPNAVRDRDPRTVYLCEVCDKAADHPPCPTCDIAICEVCRGRGALCVCWLQAKGKTGKARLESPTGRSTPAIAITQKTKVEAEAQAKDQMDEAGRQVEHAGRSSEAALHGQGSWWLQGRQTTVANNEKYEGIIADEEKRAGRIIEDCRPSGHNRVARGIQQETSDQQHLQQLKEEAAMAVDSYRKAGGTEQVQSSGRFNAGQSVLQWWSNWFANTSEPREHYKKNARPSWYSGEVLNPGHYVKDLPYAGALYTGIAYVVH